MEGRCWSAVVEERGPHLTSKDLVYVVHVCALLAIPHIGSDSLLRMVKQTPIPVEAALNFYGGIFSRLLEPARKLRVNLPHWDNYRSHSSDGEQIITQA